jgi:acetyl esterase/lipase
MAKLIYVFGFALFFGGLAYYFAALAIFNILVPKDAESGRLAQNISYGPDPRHLLDVYAPRQRTDLLPVLIFVHGGSWASGSQQDYEFAGRAFAAQGYVAVLPTYRMVPQNPYPDFVEDTALAIAFAQKHAAQWGGDGARIYLAGHSAGAYNVAQAVLDRRFLVAAGVDESALKAVALMAGPYDFLPLDVTSTIDAFGAEKDLAVTQPINHARTDAPPFLLLSGDADQTVKPRNGRKLAERLKAVGAEAQTKEYAGLTHVGIMLALAKPLRGRAPVLRDVADFFYKYR